jgi:hypothetical protein
MAAQNQATHIIAFGNYVFITRRSQFCSDKIAWSATKHSAERAVHVFITNRLPSHGLFVADTKIKIFTAKSKKLNKFLFLQFLLL